MRCAVELMLRPIPGFWTTSRSRACISCCMKPNSRTQMVPTLAQQVSQLCCLISNSSRHTSRSVIILQSCTLTIKRRTWFLVILHSPIATAARLKQSELQCISQQLEASVACRSRHIMNSQEQLGSLMAAAEAEEMLACNHVCFYRNADQVLHYSGEYNLRLGIMKELHPEMVATHQGKVLCSYSTKHTHCQHRVYNLSLTPYRSFAALLHTHKSHGALGKSAFTMPKVHSRIVMLSGQR